MARPHGVRGRYMMTAWREIHARVTETFQKAQPDREILRSLTLSLIYVTLFLVAERVTYSFQFYPNLTSWYLPAGLTFTLLLVYGRNYAPVVVLAHLISDSWLHPLDMSFPRLILLAVTVGLVYLAGASAVKKAMGGKRLSFACSASFGPLLLGSIATAVAVTFVTIVNLLAARLIELKDVTDAFLVGSMGTAIGILAVSPLLILQVIPSIEAMLKDLGRTKESILKHTSHLPSRERVVPIIFQFLVVASVLWIVFAIPKTDQAWRLSCLSLPLVWVALASGLDGVSRFIFGLVCGAIALDGYFGYGYPEAAQLQSLVLASTMHGMLVGSVVTQNRLARDSDAYRNAVLSSVSYAAEQLVGSENWDTGFNEVLRRLGESSKASRVYLLETRHTEKDDTFEVMPHEWTASALWAGQHQLGMLNVLVTHHLTERTDDLTKGTVHHLRPQDLQDKDSAVFRALGIRSSLFIPVFVDQRLWGCLGLDRSLAEEDWQDSEIDALKAAGRSLGTLLARANTEEQFRRLTGNIRAVFWTSSADGRRRNYVSPAYEQIWRQSRAELRERPDAWLDSIHSKDADRVQRALSDSPDYDQVYRIVLPDRSTRWIHDRGFPVRNELGQVSQIVGIAEDISAQKEAEAKIQSTTALLATLIDNLRSAVLVEDEQHGVRHVNQVFCEMFDIPVPKESLFGTDTRLLFAKSKSFGERIEQIRQSGQAISGEEIQFEDQILQRDYVPLDFDSQELYHLWQYQNITEQKRVERQIKTSLSEKEVLLQEIHHRVKNNLQVVSSLLSLQSEQIKDKEALTLFKESQDRVRAMALVHERLYKSHDLANIDFTGYVQNLANHLMRSYGSKAGSVSLDLKVEPVPLGIDAAIPCGLIINELVSNSLKYAFPSGETGKILLRLSLDNSNTLRLHVKDDGVGLPEGLDLSKTQSLGLKLVQGLVQQLGGTLTYRNNNGTEFDISFSLNNDPHSSREARSWARSG